jgi:ribokinase
MILVIGSSNTDMVVKTPTLPKPGETLLGGEFILNQGGKGANQAVAAARLGGKVKFIARVGNDMFGHEAISSYKKEGIDISAILKDENSSTGVALINVDHYGENCIAVASGANALLAINDALNAIDSLKADDFILMQLETPLDVINEVSKKAKNLGIKVVLNPAPAQNLPAELYEKLYILSPNETEAELITGIKVDSDTAALKAAEKMLQMGVNTVIITLGSRGVLLKNASITEFIPAPKVNAVDTTAAGDCFNGALVAALSLGQDLVKASRFAVKAASASVCKMGAQQSIPYLSEI